MILPSSLVLGGQEVPRSLSVAEAIELALRNQPSLKAAEARVAGTEGLIDQSGRRRNPVFSFQTENWRAWGDPSFDMGQELDLFAFVTQPLERGGKREQRVEVARQERRIAELERDWMEWDLRQKVKSAFWRAFLSQEELSLRRESRDFFHQITESHRERVREGVIPEVDLIRVELEEDRLALSIRESEVEFDRARIELLREMGVRGSDYRFELEGNPQKDFTEGGADLPELLLRGRRSRVDLQSRQAEVRLAELRSDLARVQAKPDWDLLFGYKRTSGYDTLLGGVVIPLPFFDQNQGNILQSRFEIDYAARRVDQGTVDVEAEIRAVVNTLQRRYRMLREMDGGLLERARESWEIARASYEEGATELLRLLDAHRSWIEARLLLNRNQIELQIDIVNLEGAVGETNLPIGLQLLSVGGDVE